MAIGTNTLAFRGPVAAAALAALDIDDDGPDDAQISKALDVCRRAGRRWLGVTTKAGAEWTDTALQGIARREAEAALINLGLDPDDASAAVLGALVDEFLGAYRAH
jgi:hypothetical protein